MRCSTLVLLLGAFETGEAGSVVGPDHCSSLKGPGAGLRVDPSVVSLGNGFTCASFSTSTPNLQALRGDFEGSGAYGNNVLTAGVLELEDEQGRIHSSESAGRASVHVITNSTQTVSVKITGIQDSLSSPSVEETWTLSLAAGARSLRVETITRVVKSARAKSIRHSFLFIPTSIYALFDRGVVQMRNQEQSKGNYFSRDGLARLYSLGGAGGDLNTAGNVSIAVRRSSPGSVVLLSSSASPYTGFQDVLLGGALPENVWSAGWQNASTIAIPLGTEWKTSLELAPNNRDFPVQGPEGDLTSHANIPSFDLQAFLTGIYASPVGQLCTHDGSVQPGARVGQMATTIASPSYGYAGNYNFFDPDNYLSTAALLFSGDRYLQSQVKMVLERNGDHINSKGQLPHHFVGLEPTYQALSGETQTGPNVFWILSCFNYVKTTGDVQWLKAYMPKLRFASAFLFDMIDSERRLLRAPGSLMIDVFIRSNFTSDTNAMVVGFLREFASAERSVGNSTGASRILDIAESIADAFDKLLWSTESEDHYVTQLNLDGTTRDLVDYDSNLIALAHGLAPAARARATLQRIDRGRCTHGRATFVAEKWYGPSDTTGGNVGDSWCTMGRIGWFDALARKQYGDLKTFDEALLGPLIGDVNRWTWLHERYNCDGTPQTNRTAMYFEYPAVTAMMIHFIRYGIQLGLGEVTISPFGPTSFAYHVGDVHVEYSSEGVLLAVPGTGLKQITVEGLRPGTSYRFGVSLDAGSHTAWPKTQCTQRAEGVVSSSSAGRISFQAPVGDESGPCIVKVLLNIPLVV